MTDINSWTSRAFEALASNELGRTVVQAVDYLGERFAWILATIIDDPRSIQPSS
jgi:hypothetical protein